MARISGECGGALVSKRFDGGRNHADHIFTNDSCGYLTTFTRSYSDSHHRLSGFDNSSSCFTQINRL